MHETERESSVSCRRRAAIAVYVRARPCELLAACFFHCEPSSYAKQRLITKSQENPSRFLISLPLFFLLFFIPSLTNVGGSGFLSANGE